MAELTLLCALQTLMIFNGISSTAEETPAPVPALSAPKSPTNIIFVFPDQMRASALGYRGIEPVQTPNLDAFARESVVFTECGSNYPVCSPFRGMLMSGRYSFNNQVYGNCNSRGTKLGIELPETARCWSDVLADNNYSLGYIGKWHLDAPHEPYINCGNNRGKLAWNEWCPPARRHGFSYWHAYGTYDNHLNPLYWSTEAKRDEFKYVNTYGPKYEVDRAIDFLNNADSAFRDPQKPFAMVISMNPPHTGYNLVPAKYRQQYKDLDVEALCAKLPNVPPKGTHEGNYFRNNIRDYYAQCTAVDEQFGRLMAHLKATGLDQNTLVIFTSDHGDCMGMNGIIGKNSPFNTCIHIPCIIRIPPSIGEVPPSDRAGMFSTPDFAPTMLGLVGLGHAIPKEWDGFNWREAILNPNVSGPSQQLYLWMNENAPDVESLRKYGKRGVRNTDWIYVYETRPDGAPTETLYDLKADPYQLKNAAAENPAKCAELKAETFKMLDQFGDSMFVRD